MGEEDFLDEMVDVGFMLWIGLEGICKCSIAGCENWEIAVVATTTTKGDVNV